MVELEDDIGPFTGNFETDYLALCKKQSVKPLNLRKLAFPLPPLPLPPTPPPEQQALPVSDAEDARSVQDFNDPSELGTEGTDNDAALSKIPEPQKLGTINRLGLPQKPQRPTSSMDLLVLNNDVNSESAEWTSQKSQFRYTPTLTLETDEEGELYKVGIRGWKLPTGKMEVLAGCIPACGTITDLSLCNCGLEESHISSLLTLVLGSNVRNLCLDQNPLPDGSDHLYAYLVTEDSPLKMLSLRSNNISNKGALSLSNALKSNRCLVALNLWDNRIGSEGAESLGEALKINQNLVSLSLGRNRIGDDGAVALAKSLSKYPLMHDEIVARRKDVGQKKEDEDPIVKKAKTRISAGNRAGSSSKRPEDAAQRARETIAQLSASNGANTADSTIAAVSTTSAPTAAVASTAKPGKKVGKDSKSAAVSKKEKEADVSAPTPDAGTKGAKGSKGGKQTGATPAAAEKGGTGGTPAVNEKEKGTPVGKGAASKTDKKGVATAAAGKAGKKTKVEEVKDEEVEEPEVVAGPVEPMFEHNGQWFVWGNRVLANLNLSYTGCSEVSLRAFLNAVNEQDTSGEQMNDGSVGLCRVCFQGNNFALDHPLLNSIHSVVNPRNAYLHLEKNASVPKSATVVELEQSLFDIAGGGGGGGDEGGVDAGL